MDGLKILHCYLQIFVLITSTQVMHLDAEKEMMSQCVALLGKFIAVREPNIRYLGLVSCESTSWLLSLLLFLSYC